MKIKVLGPGCKKCKALHSEVVNALAELGVNADVEKVEDMNRIIEHDILITPGLIINDKVKSSGKLPKLKDIKKWIAEEQ